MRPGRSASSARSAVFFYAGSVPDRVETVTDRLSNPFGMRIDGAAVYGYGNPNADFHVVGDHPGRHGGATAARNGDGEAIPFVGSPGGERLLAVLRDVGLLPDDPADSAPSNLFLSYAHPRVVDGNGSEPTDEGYDDQERFLDAELRAVNAHVLLPVGDRALAYVLREHTTLDGKLPADAERLHARELRGRGFMVIPVRDPGDWTDEDEAALRDRLERTLASDYRQTKGIPTLVG
jgi:uracil-DNA glycosylase